MATTRIAYVLDIFPKVSETFVARELAELLRRGTDLRVLSLLPPRNEPQHQILPPGFIEEHACYEVEAFGDVIRDFQPELLHAHFARDAARKAWELSIAHGVPFSFTAHGYDIHRKPPPDFYERSVAAQTVVTVSESNASYIQKTFGVPRSHIHVIPCGVDTRKFCPEIVRNRTTEPPLVLCVARHAKVKNLTLLLEACSILRQRRIPFHCLMIGDGPMHSDLLAERARLGLEGQVEMPGAGSEAEVLSAWRKAAVGVLTSHNEGMPVCLMEAAACGVPVVATWVGGVPELVKHGITGLVSEPDAGAFAAKLERLLCDIGLRERMGQAARKRAVEEFSVVRQVDSLLKVWSKASTCVRA